MFPSVGSAYNVVCKLALRVLKRSSHINHVTELDGRQDTSERCKSIIMEAVHGHSFHLFIYLPRVYKSDNISEQTVGQDSKATQDALITARMHHFLRISGRIRLP